MPNSLPPALNAILTERLDPGETVTWAGQPDARTLALRSAPFALVGALGAGAVAQWASNVLRGMSGGGMHGGVGAFTFIVVGFPLLILALGFLFAPVGAYRRAKSTAYAVTNIRVLVVRIGGASVSRFSHDIADATAGKSRVADVVMTLTPTETRADFATETLSAVVGAAEVVGHIRALGVEGQR